MDLDWKKVVGSVAPVIATALGGPFAGTAVHFLSSKLLLDGSEKEPQEALSELVQNASPEILVKLKELDNEFKLEMEKIGITEKQLQVDIYKLDQMDRDSARGREIQTGSKVNSILAGVVVVGFFLTVGYAISGSLNINPTTATVVGTLIGYVSSKADQVISYYFGANYSRPAPVQPQMQFPNLSEAKKIISKK